MLYKLSPMQKHYETNLTLPFFFTIHGHDHVTWNIWTNYPMEAPYEIWLQLAWLFLRKRSLKLLNLRDHWQKSVNKLSCTHLFDNMYQLSPHRNHQFLGSLQFNQVPIYKQNDQIWPCYRMCQGEPRVFIWTKLVVLEYQMLHIKFQVNQPFGSEEVIFKVFYHIWAWQPSWSCDLNHVNSLPFTHSMEAPHEI